MKRRNPVWTVGVFHWGLPTAFGWTTGWLLAKDWNSVSAFRSQVLIGFVLGLVVYSLLVVLTSKLNQSRAVP